MAPSIRWKSTRPFRSLTPVAPDARRRQPIGRHCIREQIWDHVGGGSKSPPAYQFRQLVYGGGRPYRSHKTQHPQPVSRPVPLPVFDRPAVAVPNSFPGQYRHHRAQSPATCHQCQPATESRCQQVRALTGTFLPPRALSLSCSARDPTGTREFKKPAPHPRALCILPVGQQVRADKANLTVCEHCQVQEHHPITMQTPPHGQYT